MENESEHKKEVEKLKIKIKMMNLEKALSNKPTPDAVIVENKVHVEEIKEYPCTQCDYKTNWRTNLTDHQAKKHKKRKK